jgi:hypothetical protein
MDIRLLLDSAGPHCQPLKCGEGQRAFLILKDGFEGRTADGSGVIVATISAVTLLCANAGGGRWDYLFSIEPEEIAPTQTVAASDIASVCCLECDSEALLRKIRRAEARDFTIESFRIFGDEEGVEAGEFRLFRKHSSILLQAMEVSVARIDGGYPYAYEPGKLTVRPVSTPAQALGPWGTIGDGAVIDPASSTPLTARFEFVPPLLLDGGRAFGVNALPETAGAHFGLEVHLQFSLDNDSP